MTAVLMPQFSLAMQEGTVITRLVEDGATVEVGQAILEVETDKAIAEVEATSAGTIRFLIEEGAVVPVNSPLAEIAGEGDAQTDAAPRPGSVMLDSHASAAAATSAPKPQTPATGASGRRHRASPAARRLARELGVDLQRIEGTGPDGRIVVDDVEKIAGGDTATDNWRDQVVAQLTASWRDIPHIHIAGQLDGSGLARAKRGAAKGVTLSDFLLHIVSRSLGEVPELNGRPGSPLSQVHIALAVATPGGVISPVIRHVNQLSVEEISRERARIVTAARAGRPDRRDLAGATFTLTNLGAYPVDFFAPVVTGPQTAALAVGRLLDVPIIKDGKLEIGQRIWMNAAIDHRGADGVSGARFLAALEDQIDAL